MATQTAAVPILSYPELQKQLRRLYAHNLGVWLTASMLMLLLAAVGFTAASPQWEKQGAAPGSIIGLLIGLFVLFNAFAASQPLAVRRFQRTISPSLERIQQVEYRAAILERLSTIDPLTELFNRRYMDLRLPIEASRADRGNYPLSLLVLDLNRFKSVNDEYGHATGDVLLQAFANRIRHAIRAIDTPIRMGGDEFLICLPECTVEQVPFVVNRMRGATVAIGGQTLPIEFAAGWAQRSPGEAVSAVFERADRAMYEDKPEHHIQSNKQATSA